MRMKCPDCDYMVDGDNEEELKSKLMEHARSVHGYEGNTFEEMFGGPRAKITEVPRQS